MQRSKIRMLPIMCCHFSFQRRLILFEFLLSFARLAVLQLMVCVFVTFAKVIYTHTHTHNAQKLLRKNCFTKSLFVCNLFCSVCCSTRFLSAFACAFSLIFKSIVETQKNVCCRRSFNL